MRSEEAGPAVGSGDEPGLPGSELPGLTGPEVAELLGLQPLPDEGGLFRRTYEDGSSSAIYYLLVAPEFSAMHRLQGPEIYHFYAGAPAPMLLLHADGRIEEPVLGPDLRAGHRPQVVVQAGVWQASETLGAWTLLGTTMAPAWRADIFELGTASQLIAGWPSVAERISRLCRR